MSTGEQAHAAGDRPTVFLSYARADQPQAERLARALEAAGLRVWWDSLIEGGAAFAKSIEAALTSCDAVIVAWSKTSVDSDWVRDEAAKGRDLRKLVPLLLDVTTPPLGFGQYHAVDLSRWNGNVDAPEIAAIVRGVAAVTGSPHGPAASEPRIGVAVAAVPRASVSRRGVLLATAGTIVAGAAAVIAWRQGLFRRAASGNSVAVLPFKNLSNDPEQAYFSDGLSEEVRATLARNAALLVMAPASSGQFRDRQDDAVTIAEKLGVAYLLDGSVQRAGDMVRVAATLIDGRTGFSTWSDSFDRRMTDIFAVQSEIANTVTDALSARVIATSGSATATPPANTPAGSTTSVIAYDSYLRGRALYNLSADEASERAALAQFDAAIAADPLYAAAHAARSRSLTTIANQYGKVGQLAELYSAAVAAAQRAIEIAPDLGDAHSTLGFTLFQGRLDARAARAPFERSRALGFGDATVMARYAQYCARVGRKQDAAEAIQRALTLDPLNPLIYRAAGSIEYAAGNFSGSIPLLRRALAMNPKMSRAHGAIGDALLMLGRLEESSDEYAAEPTSEYRLAGQAIAAQRRGDSAAAQQLMQQLVAEHGDRVLYQQAQVLAQLGDRQAAVARLEQARSVGDSGLIYARSDPFLDPLRREPRFSALLNRIGLE